MENNKMKIQASINIEGLTAEEKTDFARGLMAGIFTQVNISDDMKAAKPTNRITIEMELGVDDGGHALDMLYKFYGSRRVMLHEENFTDGVL